MGTQCLAGELNYKGVLLMWKPRKEDERPYVPPQTQPTVPATPAVAPREVRSVESPKAESYRADVAHIGKSVIVKGELSGSEDLYLDGEVEGSIELRGHNLIIGPNGRVRANIHAKDVVIHGKVEGNVRGTERVELKKSANLNGDIFTQRIMIEDGAFFKGSIDIQKGEQKGEAKQQPAMSAAASVHQNPAPAATPAFVPQGSLLDKK